ncbi:hypothetical protein KP509_04G081400 [Ceratopteris richardii]|uniref:Uncharacterized protein n=1 Tax=Ceratopteris richardii TaxID=49495 RepID=A0A8T2UYX9_CERRI|nr:hypothetical protein KP509_04G081400 [Ceratopteris richardii]
MWKTDGMVNDSGLFLQALCVLGRESQKGSSIGVCDQCWFAIIELYSLLLPTLVPACRIIMPA